VDPLVRGCPPGQPLWAGAEHSSHMQEAGQGAGRGPGGPPYKVARITNIEMSALNNDYVDLAGAVNAAHQNLLDVGGPARTGDQDH
jgi:hypothetical protein